MSQVHVSLNNVDKLRKLISKIQKDQHPYGQGILGLTYNIWKCKEEYQGYVQQSGIIYYLYLKNFFICLLILNLSMYIFYSYLFQWSNNGYLYV